MEGRPESPRSVLSLFAGIGGLDLGLEAAGCRTLWYSEVDPYACQIMALRFPQAQNLGDITEIDWTKTDARPDIICGGFPCQDISIAGRGAGITDETRSGLWRFYAAAIRDLRPELVIVENVAAIVSRGLDRVLGDLAALGFDAEWSVLSACALGAPHPRERMFIVAYPSSARAGMEKRRSDRPGGADADTPQSAVVRQGDGADSAEGPRPCNQPERARYTEPRKWWKREPDIRRMAHGVPFGMDRRRCLGNAVVPQVAEHVARIALERVA